MKYMDNKKGQGGDTFKLLIAAVVAMVILGIVTGVFQNIYNMIFNISCVDNPINEMVTKIKRSQSGITTSTSDICMTAGEAFQASSLMGRVTNIKTLTFTCDSAVCTDNTPIEVTSSSVVANSDAKFRGLITCTKSTTGSGDFDCNVLVRSASQ
jgi:hypothetical protein